MIDGAATDIFFEQSMVHLREERQEHFERKTCAELNPSPVKNNFMKRAFSFEASPPRLFHPILKRKNCERFPQDVIEKLLIAVYF